MALRRRYFRGQWMDLETVREISREIDRSRTPRRRKMMRRRPDSRMRPDRSGHYWIWQR
jgi:hypothetical protein